MNKTDKATCPHRTYILVGKWGTDGKQSSKSILKFWSWKCYGENKTDEWVKRSDQRWSFEGANNWVRHFRGSIPGKENSACQVLGWELISKFQKWGKIFFRATVWFSLGSVWFISDPRPKPICMAELNNLVTSDPCAGALRMSRTHLGFILSFLSNVCIWNLPVVPLEGSIGHSNERASRQEML